MIYYDIFMSSLQHQLVRERVATVHSEPMYVSQYTADCKNSERP